MKAFFGFYIALVIGVFGLWAIQPLRAQQEGFANAVAQEVFAQINALRAEAKIAPLAKDEALDSLAHAHSLDMLSEKYFSHYDEYGCNSSCRMHMAGYHSQPSGENIYVTYTYKNNPQEVAAALLAQWTKNPQQKKNLLNPAFTHTGIGVATRVGALYVTEDFTDTN